MISVFSTHPHIYRSDTPRIAMGHTNINFLPQTLRLQGLAVLHSIFETSKRWSFHHPALGRVYVSSRPWRRRYGFLLHSPEHGGRVDEHHAVKRVVRSRTDGRIVPHFMLERLAARMTGSRRTSIVSPSPSILRQLKARQLETDVAIVFSRPFYMAMPSLIELTRL